MKNCTLKSEQKKYVLEHYQTSFIYQMARHLKTSEIFISRNMKVLGLVSPMRSQKTPIPDLTEEQGKYVIKHHKKQTISEMAIALKMRWCAVNKFVKNNKLEVIKKKCRKYELEIDLPEVPKVSIVRPPAVYSNRQYA